MDNFIVSARKYRPDTFRSVVGQQALTTTLKNAITGKKLAHAYLFSGPRGVGKTTCARIFAKTINCFNLTSDSEACNKCESCVAFNEQRSYNIHELDAASNNGVEDIRTLIDQVRIPPQIGKYKVYIIDEVHMLSPNAFNSFLKTLEEPPAHAIFILATTEKHKIIPTILSRCQVYDFNRINIIDIVEHLQYVASKEGITAEPEALNVIAQKADGGMRDALSVFDQCASYTQGNITYKSVIENLNVLDYEYYFKLTDTFLNGDVVNSLLILNNILNRGFEGQYIISGIASHFRDLLVCKDAKTAQLFEVGASIRDNYIEIAKRCSNQFLYKAIEIANDCDLNYRQSKNKRLLVELALIKLCQLNVSDEEADIKKKTVIKPIEKSSNSSNIELEQNSKSRSREKDESPKENKTGSVTTATTPNPEKLKISKVSGIGISLTSLVKKDEEVTKTTEEFISSNSNNKFTEEDILKAWNEYADNLEIEKLLKNTMSLYKPKLISDVMFEVEVNSELNKEYLTNNGEAILAFLRGKVKNDNLTMTIKISKENVIKKALTSREIFDELVQKNPSLQKLSDEFGLELS